MISLAYTLESTESGAHPPRQRSLAWWQTAGLFGLVVAIRLPFPHSSAEAGSAFEAAARLWREEGTADAFPWTLSPAYQALCALLWPAGAWATHFVTILASGWAAVSFAALARRAGLRWAAPAAFILTMIPEFWAASLRTDPLVPSMALGLAAMLAAARSRPIITGLLLGLAWVTHPSSLAFALPVLVLHLGCRHHLIARNAVHAAVSLLVALVILAGFHWALWHFAGIALFGHADHLLAEISQPNAAGEFTLQTLIGPTGQALAIASLGLIAGAVRSLRRPVSPPPRAEWSIPLALPLLLAGAIVLQLAFKPWLGNILLAFPALVYLATAWSDRRLLLLAALVLLISPWVALEGTALARGPIPWGDPPEPASVRGR